MNTRKITLQSFTQLAMPNSFIDQVNQIGRQGCDVKGLVFQNRQKYLLEDHQNDPIFNLDDPTNFSVYPVTRTELPGVDLVSHNPILQQHEHQPYEQHDTDYDNSNDMAETSAQNVDYCNTTHDNWVAPDTAPETDHLPQFAETAEDMLDTQELFSKSENEHESQPHITKLTDDDQINDHHIKEGDANGQINKQDTVNQLQCCTRQ